MKLVATVQKLTTEALGATELGTWAALLTSMWIPSWLFLSMVLLHGSRCSCLSDFVFADAQQIMESSAL